MNNLTYEYLTTEVVRRQQFGLSIDWRHRGFKRRRFTPDSSPLPDLKKRKVDEDYHAPKKEDHVKSTSGRLVQVFEGNRFRNFDVYIGSTVEIGGVKFKDTKWSNPYCGCQSYGNFDEYRKFVLSKQYLIGSLFELKGRVLGCSCMNHQTCHGRVLLELIEKSQKKNNKGWF